MSEVEIWPIIRDRLEDPVLSLMRKARSLIESPLSNLDAALAARLEGLDDERLRQLWAIIASAAFSQQRRWLAHRRQAGGSPADEAAAASAWRRHETCVALAGRIKQNLARRGQLLESTGIGSREKLEAWSRLSKALGAAAGGQPTWTAEIYAAVERLLAELEQLRSAEPRAYLDADIGWGIGMAQEGVADQLNAAGRLPEAKRRYRAAAEAFSASGHGRDARRCKLTLVAMVRRISAGFDETIAELHALLDEAESERPSVARAELRTSLAQTYAAVGDVRNAQAQLDLAAQDVTACGYAVADAENPEHSLRPWVARAENGCSNPEAFEAELASLITLHASGFEARGRIAPEQEESARQMRAAAAYAAVGERLTREVKNLLVEQSRERKAFVAEFGDENDDRFEQLEFGETRLDRRIAAQQALDEQLDLLRPEIERRKAAGAALDDLLPELDRMEAEARAHDLATVEAVTLLWRADIHISSERYVDAIASARAAFALPRSAQQDLTTGLYALDRILEANIALRSDAGVSAAYGEAIALIERHRYNVSAPYSQSAYLQDRTRNTRSLKT